jgi:hypothetical protein
LSSMSAAAAFPPTPTVRSPASYEVPWVKVPPPTPIAPYDWSDEKMKERCDDIVRECRERDSRYRVCVGKEGCVVAGAMEEKGICHAAAVKCHLFLAHCVSDYSLHHNVDCSDFFQ